MDKLIIGIIAAVCGIIVGVIVGIIYRKKFVESVIGSREEQAKHILEDAINAAEARKKEALIEAKEEIFRTKTEADNEIKDRRREVSRLEHRIAAKEEAIDNKTAALEKREEQLNQKHQNVDALRTKIQETLDQHLAALERISGLTTSEAKEELLAKVERELAHETAMKLSEHEARFKDEAEARAKDILSLAIQRCAADHVGDVTISVVSLPSEDMKGRIIGREGRNIRSIETLIGVELIIDDTPEVITISGFDPVRREIARIALEKLIADGRIHPARIEEMVDKARREVENSIKHAGEAAIFETGVHGINGELVKLLGRLKYRTSYGQNALRHSVEVSLLSGVIAEELGVDSTLAKRAGLLHDIGKALTAEAEGSHVQLGVDVARKYKEGREVIHAIEAHHNDVEPHSIVALIVQAADAISAARPGARREDVDNYIKRLQKLEEIAGEFSGVEKTFAIQAGREVRVMVSPDVIDDDRMKLLARDIAKKIESELEYPGQIKVHVIRENRIVEYAK